MKLFAFWRGIQHGKSYYLFGLRQSNISQSNAHRHVFTCILFICLHSNRSIFSHTAIFYQLIVNYFIDVTYCSITVTSWWARWRLKSPASRLFTQQFIQAQIKENIKSPRHWPLCGELIGEFHAQMWPVTRKMFPFDDVIMVSGIAWEN